MRFSKLKGLILKSLKKKSEYTLDEISKIHKEKSAFLVSDFFDSCEKSQGIRQNQLFCYSPTEAMVSAIICSIIETVKANSFNPMTYLENIFEGIKHGNLLMTYCLV
ncbi:MAG: hypothetical protein LUG26_07870 [Ruminococcus sp.]|nr:hypothetical protein [Ruminococcus sp.]